MQMSECPGSVGREYGYRLGRGCYGTRLCDLGRRHWMSEIQSRKRMLRRLGVNHGVDDIVRGTLFFLLY